MLILDVVFPGDTEVWMSLQGKKNSSVGYAGNVKVCLISLTKLLTTRWFEIWYNTGNHINGHTYTHTVQYELWEFCIDCLSASHLLLDCPLFLTCLEMGEYSTETLLSLARHFACSLPSFSFPVSFFHSVFWYDWIRKVALGFCYVLKLYLNTK